MHRSPGPGPGLQLPAGWREREETPEKGRREQEKRRAGPKGEAGWRGGAPATGLPSCRRPRPEELEPWGWEPRGTWTAAARLEVLRRRRQPHLQSPALRRDAGKPGARWGREVGLAGAADAKLAGAAVPVRARGRAAPLAAAALPAARARLRRPPSR